MQKTTLIIIGIAAILLCFTIFAKSASSGKPSDFPDDENGNVLRQMQKNGDDLTKSRNVDFTVVLPNQQAAEKLADHFKKLNYKVEIENSGTVSDLPWDVRVVKNMIPTHTDITNFEQELANFAAPLGGRNDGWGSFAQ